MNTWRQSSRPETFADDAAGGRRQAPRCEAKLGVSLRLRSPWLRAENEAPSTSELKGETRNLSETGLAVSVPSNRIGGRYFNVIGCALHLRLELPMGPVEINATLKWCNWLPEDGAMKCCHIGLRITEMSDEEWVRLVRYVHGCLPNADFGLRNAD